MASILRAMSFSGRIECEMLIYLNYILTLAFYVLF